MGSAHAKSIFSGNIKGMELAAVCDIAESKRLWADENLPGVPCYEDYKEMIDSGVCDTVIVATPHYFHSPIAIYAFEKGKNVLTEKPAGVYTKQVEEMNAAAKNPARCSASCTISARTRSSRKCARSCRAASWAN